MNHEPNQDQPEKFSIIEKPADNPVIKNANPAYDFVVSEAAVGSCEGVIFTVAGIREENRNGMPFYSTYVDINRSQIVNIEPGSRVELKEGVTLLVVDIMGATDPQKGKVYFKRI